MSEKRKTLEEMRAEKRTGRNTAFAGVDCQVKLTHFFV